MYQDGLNNYYDENLNNLNHEDYSIHHPLMYMMYTIITILDIKVLTKFQVILKYYLS